jgi:hypothetical protein
VGLGDRIRSFFSNKANPALRELEEWAATRKGIEGYIEPRTTTNPVTLLLVDRDGEHLRAPVREPEEAAAFCSRLSIPVYDAQVVGYPDRMRKRDRGAEKLDEQIAEIERHLSDD